MEYAITFPTGTVSYYFRRSLERLVQLAPPADSVIITDENLYRHYGEQLSAYKVITLPAGEAHKTAHTIHNLAAKLLEEEVHKRHLLIGFGGGVVTDVTGFLAGSYMRGLSFGFVPTTIMAMVDAAIGGKNGVNVDGHKNMLGTIRQPTFIFYDAALLSTLPDEEWSNGFAEVIKYGCISDPRILNTLEQQSLAYFQGHPQQLDELIAGCADSKNKIVSADEQECGLRRLLNFGHTAGHAFERLYGLKHGQAVGLGMLVACILSEREAGLDAAFRPRLQKLLERYNLPVQLDFAPAEAMNILKMDKKRNGNAIDYVLLEKPGLAHIKPLSFQTIRQALNDFA